MKFSHAFILVLVVFIWVVPCTAENSKITYYDASGNMVAKEVYFEICSKKNKDNPKAAELKVQLHDFLRHYCQTFENKDLNKFKSFFTADATEKGKSFIKVLPKYRRGFEALESIGYQIELNNYFQGQNTDTLELQGKFRLSWLSHGSDWKKKSGSISMSLIKYNNSYKIKRLDYREEI